MSTLTANYNLKKPDSTDPFGDFRQDYNDNMDIIDANLGGGGGSGGHTIIDENDTPMTQRTGLQFTGNVNVTDDAVNDKTVVDILGGGGNVYGAFIDTDRVITSGSYSSNFSYTATEDCFVFIGIASNPSNTSPAYIDGVQVYGVWNGSNGVYTESPLFPLKKGQTLTVSASNGSSSGYWVYGIKQGTNGIFAPVIYSDTERVIGVWRDNKPLYAKTWVLTIPSATGTYSFNEATPNLENVVHTEFSLWGLGERESTPWYTPATILFSEQTASYIDFYFASSNYAGRNIYFTSYYTKTTDVAGSGNWNTDGVPTVHYSTSEQVVGTWYNGKPIYEKVLTPSVNVGSNTIAHGIANFEECVSIRGMCKYNGTSEHLPLPYVSTNIAYVIALGNVSPTTFLVDVASGFSSIENCKVIIQYTKTTD